MEYTKGKLEVQGTNAVSNSVSINSGKIPIAHIWLPVSYEDKDKDKDYNLLNGEALANARRIVHCCNNYDALYEACISVQRYNKAAKEGRLKNEEAGDYWEVVNDEIKAALEQATRSWWKCWNT